MRCKQGCPLCKTKQEDCRRKEIRHRQGRKTDIKLRKRLLSLALALVFAFYLIPTQVYAAGPEKDPEVVEEITSRLLEAHRGFRMDNGMNLAVCYQSIQFNKYYADYCVCIIVPDLCFSEARL